MKKTQYEAFSKEETDQFSILEVVERTWQILKTSMVQAAEKVLPKKDRVKRKSWMTNEILQKMREWKKRKGTEKYKEIDTEIRGMCKERKEAWWNEKCKEIEELERKHKTKDLHAKGKEMKKKMNLFGYTYKIYDIGYKTEMMNKKCNAGDPLETPGGLYRGPPSNENTIFKKMCVSNIKFQSVQYSFTMNVNQLQ